MVDVDWKEHTLQVRLKESNTPSYPAGVGFRGSPVRLNVESGSAYEDDGTIITIKLSHLSKVP